MDGTVKDRQGGAAYTTKSTHTLGTVRSIIPVDGLSRHMTPYCTNIFDILGALIFLQGLLAQRTMWDRLSAVLWCNNKDSVRKYHDFKGTNHFSLTAAN